MAQTTSIGGAATATPTAPAAAAGAQYPAWIVKILTAIGAPINGTTADNLAAWYQCEGSPPGNNNPFNTTLQGASYPGTSINSVNVQAYTSPTVGIAATVATLLQANFASIVTVLKNSAPRGAFAATVGSSGWGTDGTCIANAPGLTGNTDAVSGTLGSSTATGTAGAGTESSVGTGSGCNATNAAKGDVFDIQTPGSLPAIKLNWCQAKAITGGMLMAAGGMLGLVGVLILARGAVSTAAAGAIGAAAGPAGLAAGAVAGRAPARAPAAARTEAGLGPNPRRPAPVKGVSRPGPAGNRRPAPKKVNRAAGQEGSQAYDAGYQKAMADLEARARAADNPF